MFFSINNLFTVGVRYPNRVYRENQWDWTPCEDKNAVKAEVSRYDNSESFIVKTVCNGEILDVTHQFVK